MDSGLHRNDGNSTETLPGELSPVPQQLEILMAALLFMGQQTAVLSPQGVR